MGICFCINIFVYIQYFSGNVYFTDIFLNVPTFIAEWNNLTALTILDNYIQFVFLGIIFIFAVCFLLKKSKVSTFQYENLLENQN